MARVINLFVQIFLGCLILVSLLIMFFPGLPLVNFLSHFLIYYLFASLVVFITSLSLKSFNGSFIGLFLMLCFLYPLRNLLLPAPNISFGEACADLKIMQVNLRSLNLNSKEKSNQENLPKELLKINQEISPEILFFSSVSSKQQESLSEDYPYRIFQPYEDGLGVAILSKIPIADINLPLVNKSIVEVGLKLAGDLSINILGFGNNIKMPKELLQKEPLKTEKKNDYSFKIDPNRPVLSEYEVLPSIMQMIAKRVRTSQQPYVLIGNLNSTPWSTFYKPIERFTGLKNAGNGKGIMSTWPASIASIPILKYFALPIEQTLVHRSLEVKSHESFKLSKTKNLGLVSHIKVPCDLSTSR